MAVLESRAMTVGRYEIARRRGDARATDARQANDRIAEKAERLRFVSRVPMLCECSDRDCRTVVMVRLEDYHAIRRDRAAFLTAPGHAGEAASSCDLDELRSA